MKKIFLKSKLLLSFITLVLLVVTCLHLYKMKIRESEPTSIFEINNTERVYNYLGGPTMFIEKHYMIIEPPEDLSELKTLVEEFYKENPVKEEVGKVENKSRKVMVFFYRESKKLPRDWQPDEAYFNTDRIEHHKDDCIAVIYNLDNSPQNEYDMMKKSKNRENYGKSIEEIDYLDDKIIRQESYN